MRYQRPQERLVEVERVEVEGQCPNCGEHELRRYQVLTEGGFYNVVKCQSCLTSVSRERDEVGPIQLFSATI